MDGASFHHSLFFTLQTELGELQGSLNAAESSQKALERLLLEANRASEGEQQESGRLKLYLHQLEGELQTLKQDSAEKLSKAEAARDSLRRQCDEARRQVQLFGHEIDSLRMTHCIGCQADSLIMVAQSLHSTHTIGACLASLRPRTRLGLCCLPRLFQSPPGGIQGVIHGTSHSCAGSGTVAS